LPTRVRSVRAYDAASSAPVRPCSKAAGRMLAEVVQAMLTVGPWCLRLHCAVDSCSCCGPHSCWSCMCFACAASAAVTPSQSLLLHPLLSSNSADSNCRHCCLMCFACANSAGVTPSQLLLLHKKKRAYTVCSRCCCICCSCICCAAARVPLVNAMTAVSSAVWTPFRQSPQPFIPLVAALLLLWPLLQIVHPALAAVLLGSL
jgi:hypothetical protein